MNNRKRSRAIARHKVDISRRKGLHKLFDLVLDINGTNRRDREITGNLPTAFFDFSGHTAATHMRVYTDGWESGDTYDWCDDVWEDESISIAIDRLEKLKLDLQRDVHE